MNSTRREQRAERHTVFRDLAIRQYDQTVAFVDRLLRFPTDAVQRGEHTVRTGRTREGNVDRATLPAAMIHMLDRCQLFVRQDITIVSLYELMFVVRSCLSEKFD